MYAGKTLFAQLMDFVPWTTFTRIVSRYGGEPTSLGGAATALFDPAMAGVGLLRARATGGQSRIGEEQLRILVQTGLIAFEGEQVIRALVGDAPGDLLVRPHGVDRHDGALEVEHVQEFRDRRDLVGLSVDCPLGEHEPRLGGVSRNQMQRALPGGA